MSEPNTPQSNYSSFDNNDTSSANDDSLDELIAFLDDSNSESENIDPEDPLFIEEAVEEELNQTSLKKDVENPQEEELSNESLYEQNHRILYHNAQLQKALESTQAELEQQKFQLRQAEELNEQQSDELNAAYEQHLSLSQELKSTRQNNQYQEEQITHLRNSLQVSQQRVAQLERECALIQKQFQEQSYKLSQAEKQVRELSFRLQQQRRYTWQFKVALNKYLENNPQIESNYSLAINSVPSQPIPAWSSQNQTFSNSNHEAKEFSLLDQEAPEEAEQQLLEDSIESPSEAEISRELETSNTEIEDFNIHESSTESLFSPQPTNESVTEIDPPSHYPEKETSPSPTLPRYQNRKKRTSYASVQLPNFNR